jgi:uncharacterized protein (DUF305 family)
MIRKYANLWLLVLVLTAVLVLASSCAGSSTGEQGSAEQGTNEESTSAMQGMEHTDMEIGSGQMTDASQLVMENGKYSDELFIDAMVPHHQGAIDMAEVALQNAEHPEIRTLATNIISAQEAEIEQLKAIKQRQYGTAEVPTQLSSEEMQMMGMTMSPQELANEQPFDKAFIDAMIPHHHSAIEMAQVAQENSTDPEIQDLAQGIITGQQAEIQQMTDWRKEWYPEG